MFEMQSALAQAGLATKWYRWCDANRNWSADAVLTHADDSLLTGSGGYAALPASEFHEAFRSAGADVLRGSTFPGPRHRSFTVEVATEQVVSSLAVQLGRGLNALECSLTVTVDGVPRGGPELLHVAARKILQSQGKSDPDPRSPYPRPIIGSRSQLEVVSRELVETLTQVARGSTS